MFVVKISCVNSAHVNIRVKCRNDSVQRIAAHCNNCIEDKEFHFGLPIRIVYSSVLSVFPVLCKVDKEELQLAKLDAFYNKL